MLGWLSKSANDNRALQDRAELVLCRQVQAAAFPEEYQALAVGRKVHRESKLLKFKPFMEQGVIRVGGRLDNAEVPYAVKHPVLLADHYITKLLLVYLHESSLHQGVETTLVILRQKFWVIRGRRLLR